MPRREPYIPLEKMDKIKFYVENGVLRKEIAPQLEEMIPFALALIAPRERGKSFFIDAMITHIAPKYQKVFIVSPSATIDPKDFATSRHLPNVELVKPDKQWCVKLQERAEELCRNEMKYNAIDREGITIREGDIIEYKAPHFLVIFDDCMERKELVHFRGPAEILATRGRHCRGSIVTSSQDIHGISPAQRGNSEIIGILNLKNEASMEKFYKEYIPKKSKEIIFDMVEDLLYTPFVFMLVNTNAIRKDEKLLFTTTQEFFAGVCYAVNL